VPKRLAVPCFIVAIALVAIGYATAFATAPLISRFGEWCMVFGVAGSAVAALGFFEPRDASRRGVFRAALVLTFVALVAGLGLPLALPRGTAATEGLLLGLPFRAAIVVYVAGMLPLVVLPIAYAYAFELGPAARREEVASAGPPAAGPP
jgi:hypothetical protein